MPIHYDTIEDEQNKKSHILNLVTSEFDFVFVCFCFVLFFCYVFCLFCFILFVCLFVCFLFCFYMTMHNWASTTKTKTYNLEAADEVASRKQLNSLMNLALDLNGWQRIP